MSAWLTIIGLGDDGLDGLSPSARALVDGARIIVGGQRHLDLVGAGARGRVWPSPFETARPWLEGLRDQHPVILASGEPLWFGAGSTLAQWFGADALHVVPHVGAFSLTAARAGWALQECLCLTIHGRPLDSLRLHLAPGRKLLILSENGQSPVAVARLLEKAGFGQSPMQVWQHLGGKAEAVKRANACDFVGEVADLNTIAVEIQGGPALSLVPGLPDDAFAHDGQLTKREVRAVTLAHLAPLPGQTLWDVGAGCGSVAIEWMRSGGRATAIEANPARLRLIAQNAQNLGVPDLKIIAGLAPDCLPFADPDAIFVGGGVSAPGLLDACWAALKPGGRMVVNAVTHQGEQALGQWLEKVGGSLTRLQISRLKPLGKFHTWKTMAPVTQWAGIKP